MHKPTRILISGTSESVFLRVAKDFAKEVGVPMWDFTEISVDEIPQELRRLNGGSGVFAVLPEAGSVEGMGSFKIFLCGSDCPEHVETGVFQHIMYLNKGWTVRDIVLHLQATTRRILFPLGC